jgi:hypothetical protein
MTTQEKALLTYKAIEKRKQKKKQQLKQDLSCTGWNGFTKFKNRELKKYY